jgi:hypothetical protein
VKFFLDEDVDSSAITAITETLGLDVTSVSLCDRLGPSDEEQLSFAAAEGRCLVTRNYDDFIALTESFRLAGRQHAGVLLVPRAVPNGAFAPIARGLAAYHDRYPEGMPPYMVDWLPPVR